MYWQKPKEIKTEDKMTNIRTYFTNQDIFITGGSGYIGKSLLEKILRSLPNCGNIYVLMRNKRGKTSDERLQEILNSLVFERAREEQPNAFKKVFVISGDCLEIGLGISAQDLQKLKNVNFIFHSAACVRFDDPLKNAILLNTRGTHELLKIAEKMPHLKAFVHVSTAYAYPELQELDERIKPISADWRTSIKLAETYDSEILDTLFPKYSNNQANSYTFTKSLAEQLINDFNHRLPLIIVRPSIVIGSVEEPFPGYIDNFNGPTGMLIACAIGIMRTHLAEPDNVSDFIPVDICSRSLLLAAYKRGTQKYKQEFSLKTLQVETTKKEVDVINCANSSMSILSNRQLIDLGKVVGFENPLERAIWLPEGSITRCAVWHYLRYITLQIIPSILLDCVIRLAGHPPILMQLQRRIHSTANILNIFFNTQFQFVNDNLINLDKLLSEEELPVFGVYIYVGYDQATYMANGLMGAKKCLLKEPPIASPQARLRMHIFRILHYTFQFIGICYLVKYLWNFLCNYSF